MNKQQVEQELEPILEQQRKNAGLFDPVARGMELSVMQHKTERLTPSNCYEHGFTYNNGRFV